MITTNYKTDSSIEDFIQRSGVAVKIAVSVEKKSFGRTILYRRVAEAYDNKKNMVARYRDETATRHDCEIQGSLTDDELTEELKSFANEEIIPLVHTKGRLIVNEGRLEFAIQQNNKNSQP